MIVGSITAPLRAALIGFAGLTGLAGFALAQSSVGVAAPCQAYLAALKPGSEELPPWLAAAACFRKLDSSAHGVHGSGPVVISASDSIPRKSLPESSLWYIRHLQELTAKRDAARLPDLAYLVWVKSPRGSEVWKYLAEALIMAGEGLQASRAYLRMADQDSSQAKYARYLVGDIIRSSAGEVTPHAFLDSLDLAFRPSGPASAEVREDLAWEYGNYPSAFRNISLGLGFGGKEPPSLLEKVGRFHAAGYYDLAESLLSKLKWKTFPKPFSNLARSLYFRIHFQLEDWEGIVNESTAIPQDTHLSEEEDFILASAFIHADGLNQERETSLHLGLARLERFKSSEASPWAYRGQLLRAQAYLALSRLPEASRQLDALKKSPYRREATGPILFWQGWLALYQGQTAKAESLLVLASAYTGGPEAERALELRYWMMLDTTKAQGDFFQGLKESPLSTQNRIRALDRLPLTSPLWPHARLEKAQILIKQGLRDSAKAILEEMQSQTEDSLLTYRAEAMAAYLEEKLPNGRSKALVRYENLLIKYQQGVTPEFSRGRIRALKRVP